MQPDEGVMSQQMEALLSACVCVVNPSAPAAHLIATLRAIQAAGLDRLPLPGGGATLARWRSLARVAAADLCLVKLFEAHTDALAILHECRAQAVPRNGIWAVWAAEPPDARLTISGRSGADVRVSGRKAWCSGAAEVDHALMTCWDEDDTPRLVAVSLSSAGIQRQPGSWNAIGMAATASLTLEFDEVPARCVGAPGEYLARPGFWHGGGGIAACWYGAACGLATRLLEHGRQRPHDQHARAHLGAVEAALGSAAACLRECAAAIDAAPQADAGPRVRTLRAQVEHAVNEVILHTGRALGAAPFCLDAQFARLAADLPVFMRQSHAERDLAALGEIVARDGSRGCAL